VPQNAFAWLRQTIRNEDESDDPAVAGPVADGQLKPTAANEVELMDGVLQVFALLSTPIPIRVWQDPTGDALRRWLETELRNGVLNTFEDHVVAKILADSDVSTTMFATDMQTTLRTALADLRVADEQPTHFVLHPYDEAKLDLDRADDPYLAAGPGYANVFKNLPVVVSRSVPEGTALLADWSSTVQVFEHTSGVKIDWDFWGADLFDRNLSKARVEARMQGEVIRGNGIAVIELEEGSSS
jgi:hypothetical protein